MAQKREIYFDTLYGGPDGVDKDEMLDGNKDLLMKNTGEGEDPNGNVKLKEEKQLKAENNLKINDNEYHISF